MLQWILPSRSQRPVGLLAGNPATEAPRKGIGMPIVISLVAVLLTTAVLFFINSYLAAQHLVLGYLLPTMFIAVYFGSTIAVLTALASGVAAAYFLFPPLFSFYIADPLHIAELGFFTLLAIVASKAVGVLADDSVTPGNRVISADQGFGGGPSHP
jgi:K+-sensing histidine kinase KdpD